MRVQREGSEKPPCIMNNLESMSSVSGHPHRLEELGGTEASLSLPDDSSRESKPTKREPDLAIRELLTIVVVSAVVFIGTVSFLGSWRTLVLGYGDNGASLPVADAIRHWNFSNLGIQHFMGYSYSIAVFSWLFHVPLPVALWLIACSASLTAVVLISRLFGAWVAAYFALSNFAWLQLSFLGGSEPLAVGLAMASLLLFRNRQVFLAALLGAIAVTVRPTMICVLVGIGLVLLYRRQFRDFLITFLTSVIIGGLYVTPLTIYFGDPLLTVHSYTSRDYGAAVIRGPHGHLFGWPFHGIIVGTIVYPAPITNLLLSFGWILLVMAGVGMMFSKHFRAYVRTYPNEGFYCGLYLLTLFCYDYLVWARGNFMRFSIPVLPFVFYALISWLPKDRRFLWLLGITSAVLAGCSAVGIHNLRFHH
jgi:hypothetical protein